MTEQPLILVVDDDPDFIELSRLALERAGYRVVGAGSPAEALKAVAAERPALIISDLMMNSTDAGFLFARRIKEDAALRDIPVVIVSAIANRMGFDLRPADEHDLSSMRAEAFLRKPVAAATLASTVGKLLAERRAP